MLKSFCFLLWALIDFLKIPKISVVVYLENLKQFHKGIPKYSKKESMKKMEVHPQFPRLKSEKVLHYPLPVYGLFRPFYIEPGQVKIPRLVQFFVSWLGLFSSALQRPNS